MKKSGCWLLLTLLLSLPLHADSTSPTNSSPSILANLRPEHPRLLATTADWNRLRARRIEDLQLNKLLAKIESAARDAAKQPPVTYQKEGRRLLAVSREVLRRIMLWSFCYRATGDRQFVERAQREMLTVAAFQDWNPSHFLDVAEMTAAMAIGYDWLFDALDPATRTTIRKAIVEKGIKPGLSEKLGWHQVRNNWNQVCYGGLTLGALAVAEDEPEVAAQLLESARTNIYHGLETVAPDGIYPEGPGYWNYGTSYQVLMIAALESALGNDWGLSASPGFLLSAAAQVQQTGPTGRPYNFSDGGESVAFRPLLWWFAPRLHEPGLVYAQQPLLAKFLASGGSDKEIARFLPLLALWLDDLSKPVPPPALPRAWHGEGVNPLGVFRSSWTDPNALYLAFKGGSASGSHAHMDAGSFVFEADGVRWACDLGAQDYFTVESKGWNLWSFAQDSDRWRVYRLNNFSHNTLTLGGKLHRVAGKARITEFSTNAATVDLTEIFSDQASKVQRHFEFGDDRKVVVRDELSGMKPGTSVRWQMVTRAKVSLEKDAAILRQDGKMLRAEIVSPAGAKFEVAPADPPQDGVNQPNPGTRILFVTTAAPADGALQIAVTLQRE